MEDMEKFADALDVQDILSRRSKILPNAGTGKFRLETEKVRELLDAEGAEYERVENDFDVYSVLVALSGLKRKNFLRRCFKEVNLQVDNGNLNKLDKSSCAKLFFSVFDVYPKIDFEPEEEIFETSAEAFDLREVVEKIFPTLPDEKIKLSAQELTTALQIERLTDDDAIAENLRARNGGEVKDIITTFADSKNLEVIRGELNKLLKDQTIKIFFEVFDCEHSPETVVPPAADENETCDISLEQMQTIFNRATLTENRDIQAADERTIYKNMPVTVKDAFELKIKDANQLFNGLAVLINSRTSTVAAVGKIEYGYNSVGDYTPHLVFDPDKILYEEFRRQQRFDIALLPATEKNFLVGEMTDERAENSHVQLYLLKGYSFRYGELQKTARTLCIDFGTSNTTVGTYGLLGKDENKINLVTFTDVTEEKPVAREMVPTMVYVESCLPNEEVRYKFGYDAKNELIKSDYNTDASIFYELKRWINSVNEPEEIYDKTGNRTHVVRKEILKKYLEFVIRQAEQQFKVSFQKLHFSAPVKLKENFLSVVKEMFPEYNVMDSSDSLDEGMSIIYNHISRTMKRPEVKDEYSENVLILDCGGGTTDLANCKYRYRQTRVGKTLEIKTNFENGESNFGGNNITYRILQMVKIKIAQHFKAGENILVKDLLALDEDGKPKDENSILKDIDDDYGNLKKIYAAFEKKYAEAEDYVPTRFADVTMREDRRMIKRNFYYLWQMAEAIKIQFYMSDIVNVDFNKDDDREIYIGDAKQYHLAIRKDGKGEMEDYKNPLDDIEITFKEIDSLIKPDIYALLNAMLRLYESDDSVKNQRLAELSQYIYKLSGQSCKITLFADLLKEFIPGKLLRRGRSQSVSKHKSEELKKYCIEGSIEYIRDRARGFIQPKIERVRPPLIYDVSVEGREEFLLARDGTLNALILPGNTREIRFIITDEKGTQKNSHLYKIEVEGKGVSFEKLRNNIESQTYFTANQLSGIYDELSNIDPQLPDYGGDEVVFCVFTLPSRDGFGIRIYQVFIINRGDGKKYLLPEKAAAFVSYENEQLMTFFEGDF